MAESSSLNSTSPEITPKKEPITLDKPESPNPFLPADQVEFTLKRLSSPPTMKLHYYIPHTQNQTTLRLWHTSFPGGIRGYMGITTFRNALREHCLLYSGMYVLLPSITIVRPWFATIGYSREIRAKGTLKKSFLPPSFFHFHSESASGCDASADSISEAEPRKSAPNDSISHQQSMDEGIKNYAQGHIFTGTNPSVLVDQTKFARNGLKTVHTDLGTNEESIFNEISKKIKLKDLLDLIKDTRSAFFTPNSPQDDPIIVSDEREK
nr:hypothetical protein [Tanacetum cinerariifolium]GEZ10578.1 hypothetical protein [Tanacetum cinerariifolium]